MAEGTQSEGPGGGPPGGQARTLGLIAAGGALALAIGVAVFGEDPRPAPAPADPPSAVAPETPATPADPQASPAFGVAMADCHQSIPQCGERLYQGEKNKTPQPLPSRKIP